MKTKHIVSFLVIFLASACSAKPTSQLRDYYYTGITVDCATSLSAKECTDRVGSYINLRDYELLPVAPENASDAFYLGMLNGCLKISTPDVCASTTDQAIKNKYFEQLKSPLSFPTPEKPA